MRGARTPARNGPGCDRETSLYAAVKEHLERLGYQAKGEVCGCDIVAVRPGEPPFLVVTELKLGFTLDLVLQGVDRLAIADEVWLAVRATRRGRDRDRRARKYVACSASVCSPWTPSAGTSRSSPSPALTAPGQMPSAAPACSRSTEGGAATPPWAARPGRR
jgi:hypothetical protein